MRRKHTLVIAALILSLILSLALNGCGTNGNTIDEPDEITTEYLYGEYAEQLVRDGAEILMGTVTMESDGNAGFNLITESMVIVESDMTDAGYYIADANISTVSPLDPTARITYVSDKEIGPEIITHEEFAHIVNADDYNPLEEGSEQLYEVYTIGGTVLMVLAKELPVSE